MVHSGEGHHEAGTGMDWTTGFSWLWLLRMWLAVPTFWTAHRRIFRWNDEELWVAARQSVYVAYLRRSPKDREKAQQERRIIQNANLGKSFTEPQSSSPTGASCRSGSRWQRPRF